MHQISEIGDAALNRLSREIGAAEDKIEKGEEEKTKAWSEVFDVFDEFGLEGKEARFIASDGYTISRQQRKRTSKLDSEAVKQAIFLHYSKVTANRLWNMITERVISPSKLTEALLHGRIDPEVVKDLLPETKTEPARVRIEWTKEDKERAVIFGIEQEE